MQTYTLNTEKLTAYNRRIIHKTIIYTCIKNIMISPTDQLANIALSGLLDSANNYTPSFHRLISNHPIFDAIVKQAFQQMVNEGFIDVRAGVNLINDLHGTLTEKGKEFILNGGYK